MPRYRQLSYGNASSLRPRTTAGETRRSGRWSASAEDTDAVESCVLNRPLRINANGDGLVLVPLSGITTVQRTGHVSRRCCAGHGLLLPTAHEVSLSPAPETAGRLLLVRLEPQTRAELLQGLERWETSFETAGLMGDLLLPPGPAVGSATADGARLVLDFIGWRYAEHHAAIRRLPGATDHRYSLYARLLTAHTLCEEQLDVRIGELGARVHLSQAHFARLFRTAFGVGPQQHLIRCRMLRAIALVTWSTVPVNEIADQCGYTDRSAFTRSFSRVIGIAPGELRVRATAAGSERDQLFFDHIYELFRC